MAGKPRGAPPPPHGTRARYQRHRLDGEDACDACMRANREERARQRSAQPRPEPYPVAIAVYPAIDPLARLLLGNELEWDGQPPYGVRREYVEFAP